MTYQENRHPTILGQSASSPIYDAFGRIRVSEPQSVYYGSFQYGISPYVWNTALAGTGAATHNAVSASATIATSADGDAAILQTVNYHRYQPGKSQLVKVTGAFLAASPATTKRMGYYDNSDGIYLQQSGDGTISICLRSSVSGLVVDTAVPQSQWNGDRMTDVDFTRSVILLMDIEWLGVGDVRVGFVHRGQLRYAHTFSHSGIVSVPYMRTASLPMRYEISQSGAGSGSMNCICSAVDSEGGIPDEFGLQFEEGSGVTAVATVAETVVLALRPGTSLNSVPFRKTIRIDSFSAVSTGNTILARLYIATGVSGGSWTNVATNISGMEINRTATSFTGGVTVSSQYCASTAGNRSQSLARGINSLFSVGLNIAGDAAATHIVVTAQPLTGTPDALATVSWRELG